MPLYTSYAHSHRFTTTPTYSTLNRTYSSLSVPCYMEENVSPIYCVSGGVDTIFRGKKSEGRNFYKNRQKITDISAIYRFQAINRWYNGKKGQKKKKSPIFWSVNALQCTLKILLLLCCWRDSNPTTRASMPFVKYIALKIYIQSHHVKKILKENFREQIKYNYFIIKKKSFNWLPKI